MKQRQQIRYLITAIKRNYRTGGYDVDALRVDNHLNMATQTGVGTTVSMTIAQVQEARMMHQLKTNRQLVGAPIICTVSYDTPNILGSSAFERNTY